MPTDLTLLIWPDYISPATLQQFKSEYNLDVHLEIVPSAVELLDRMRAPGTSPDLLVPPDYAVRELSGEGRLAALDHSLLPNLQFLDPRFRLNRPHDPDTRVSVIKDWGTTGFMVRTDVVRESPKSWADFWALAPKYSGRVVVLDSPGEVIGAALKMRGHSYNATEPEALAQARTDLLALKPHLAAFDTNYRPLLASGAAALALGWNGDAAALAAQGLPMRYVVPSEGSQIWEDDWAIAADAPHPELAHAFLNFLLRPQIAVQEALYTRYATGNLAAFDLLPAEVRTNSSTYPSAAVLQKLEAGLPLSPEGVERREVLWKETRG